MIDFRPYVYEAILKIDQKDQERNKQGVGQLFCWIYAVRSLLKILLKLLKEESQNHKECLSKLLGQTILKTQREQLEDR